jgi:predicted acetyltransferase
VTDSIELRPFTRDEFAVATELVELAFMLQGRPEDREVFAAVLEFERSLGAFAGARMVGTAAAHSFELTVPGGTAPAGGVTIVTVHPAYRRRGILSSMMDRQLADLREGGEAIAVLRASEASIYSRFGYATASRELSLDLDRWAATLVPDAPTDKALSLDLADPAHVRDELAAVYDAVRAGTPGFIGRSGPAWADVLHDPDHRRGGATALRAALVGDGTTTSGYATYRVREKWDDNGLPTGSVIVEELVASTPAAAAALWRHVLDIDLTARISLGTRPVDEPLLRLLANPRRARAQVFDSLWLRLVRLGEALAARRYAAPVDLVLEVTDTRCPWNAGRWRLAGDESGATCTRSRDPADLRLDTTALAGAYLGDPVLAGRAAAGLIDERRPGALRRLATSMGWSPGPWCPHHF